MSKAQGKHCPWTRVWHGGSMGRTNFLSPAQHPCLRLRHYGKWHRCWWHPPPRLLPPRDVHRAKPAPQAFPQDGAWHTAHRELGCSPSVLPEVPCLRYISQPLVLAGVPQCPWHRHGCASPRTGATRGGIRHPGQHESPWDSRL